MTSPENQVDTPNSNRLYIIVGVIFGLFALIAVAVIVTLLISAPPSNENNSGEGNNNGGSSNSETLTKADVPDASSVTATVDPDRPSIVEVSFTIDAPADGLVSEYELLDVNRKSILRDSDNGTLNVEQDIPLADGVNSFTLRVRVTDGVSYSPWVSGEPVELEETVDVPGVGVNAEPNPEYFDTDWANGVSSEAAFEEALTVAWGATKFEAGHDACSALNEASLRAGEMIPPVPNGVPENTVLKYDYRVDGNAGNEVFFMAFLWCETR